MQDGTEKAASGGGRLKSTVRDWVAQISRPLTLGALAIVSVVLTLAAPYGTASDFTGPGTLFLYWAAIVALTYSVGLAVELFVFAAIEPRGLHPAAAAALGALAAGVPVTGVVMLINIAVHGWGSNTVPVWLLWLNCTVIAFGVGLLVTFSNRSRAVPEPAGVTPAAQQPQPPAILKRVPLPQRGKLLALSVSDHYVEIVTDRGRSLVLMRLSDAIDETGDVPGLRIHRSHWVARDAVARSVQAEGRLWLELANGDRLPVSRGYAPAVKEAGLVV